MMSKDLQHVGYAALKCAAGNLLQQGRAQADSAVNVILLQT